MSEADDRTYRRKFYPAVDQRQALDDRQSRYYVPIYDRPELAPLDFVRELFNAIDFSAGQSVHLVSGFRGSGKTSELLRLIGLVRDSGRPAVYMDIEDFLNTEIPLDQGAFPIMLAAGFVSGDGMEPSTRTSLVKQFVHLLGRINIEPTFNVNAVNLSAELKVSLRSDQTLARRISDAVSSNRRTFREELHAFFKNASVRLSADKLSTDQTPVYIVDSIDHFRGRSEMFETVRESVERAFTEFAEELILPGMHVIYTVPVYVQSDLGPRHDVFNVKVAYPDGTPCDAGLAAMREVLERRAPGGDLERLTGPFLDRLIMQSGGLFRDLLRLTGQLIQTSQHLPASAVEVDRAEMIIRNDYEGTLSQEKIAILRGVAQGNTLIPRKDQWSDAMDLMARGAILKYPNSKQAWYGVHPLLRPLLGD
ncbi:MAG: CobW-like GTP-binding protein [Actinomycetia bacterium]|nr:CobW-like GTP-binding protein [Actinomycetes bacterium]